jgi:hypothetical protein
MKSLNISGQQRVLTQKDHRYILIIGGISIFLTINPVEACAHAKSATVAEEGQLVVIVMEEKEKVLTSTPVEEEEHSTEFLKIFSQGS